MNAKTSLIIPALILAAAAFVLLNRTMAQPVTTAGSWPRDLTLLDQPHNNQRPNGLASQEVILDVGTVIMNFPEGVMATNRPVMKFGRTGMTPVICESHMPYRLVLKPLKTGQNMQLHISYSRSTFSGGVKAEVFIQDQPAFDVTADEVTVEP